MEITIISDTHGQHNKLEKIKSDLVIHAGDCTGHGSMEDIERFLKWYSSLDCDEKILVAGNHDIGFEKNAVECEIMCEHYGITYLYDKAYEYKGINIWGSPVQPEFFNWSFNRARTLTEAAHKQIPEIKPHWDKIPKNTDILITHGPPFGILDETVRGDNAGCDILRKKVEIIKPKLHAFGHIHEGRGVYKTHGTTFVNASFLNFRYQPYKENVHKFNWDDLK